MDIKELREKLVAAEQKAKAIQAGADASDRDLNKEEADKVDALLDEAEGLKAQVDEAERAAARSDRLKGLSAGIDKPRGRRTQPDDVATPHVTARPAWEDDPNRGFRNSRDFLTAVMNQGLGKADERLMPLKAAAGSDEHQVGNNQYGGFAIPDTFVPNVLMVEPEADPIAGRTRMIPMATASVKIPARVDKDHSTSVSGGLTVTRKLETVAGTSSRMSMEQVSLQAHTLFGVSYATEELLNDSPISFAALLSQGFQDEFTSHAIDERLNGTGVGEFEGILNSPALVSVSKETGQAADTILYENVIKMRARCWRYSNAIWLANHDAIPQLMLMNQAVGTGGVQVWQPSAREDHPDMLLGRPIIFTEYCQTVGDKGDIVCANWGEYLEGMYQPIQNASSIHVRFLEHERTFKFWLRNAGACWWRSALTPKNSTSTLSPFVTLNARA